MKRPPREQPFVDAGEPPMRYSERKAQMFGAADDPLPLDVLVEAQNRFCAGETIADIAHDIGLRADVLQRKLEGE